MSKLLKSKFLLGVMIVAVLAVAGAVTASAQTTTVIAPAFTYSGVMKVGMSGPGISTLQAALNSVQSGTIVVDGKFGPATLAAVKQFQMSKGLVADGVVGPMTGNALAQATVAVITIPTPGLPAGCTSTSGYSSTTGVRCDSGSSLPAGCTSTAGYSPSTGVKCDSGSSSNNDNNNGSLSGGETDINDVNVDDADDDSINEGASKTDVATIEFDVDDADAELVRADIIFDGTGNDEDRPWNVFDKVYLMDGSDVIASMDTDSKDAWDETDTNDVYSVRLTGIDSIFRENDSASLTVAVDVASSVDGADTPGNADWNVSIDNEGLRFVDGAGIDTFVDAGSDEASFSIEQAGAQSDVNITKASSSPDAQTLQVKESASTTQTIAVFKVKTDEDGNQVKIDDFPIELTVNHNGGPSDGMDDIVDDVYVVIDGTTYSTDTTPSATLETQTFTFGDIEDDDVMIDAGDDMMVTVKVKFKSQGSAGANYANGATIVAAADVAAGDFEDADTGDDIGTVSGGSSSGETMTLAGNGIMVDVNSAATTVSANDGVNNDNVEFKWTIDVTAFGDNDVYINKDVADIVQSQDAADVDTVYTVQQSGGTALAGLSGTITTSSSADTATGTGGTVTGETFYKISSGDTETFTITVSTTNTADSKQVQAILSDIEFVTALNAATVQHYSANLADDSQTGYKLVN